MDQQSVKLFYDRNIVLKNLKTLDLSEFSRSRSLKAFFGVNLKDFYTIIFIRNAKSRILRKELETLNELVKKYENKFGFSIKKRTLFYNSQICSKALIEFKKDGWICYDFV